jgi:spore maturation protein SpmA
MLNFIWLALVVAAALIGGFTGQMQAVSDGAIKGAETAVTLAIGLTGVMTLWLGMMRLAELSGLIQTLACFLRPALIRLFPEVPPDDPAMGSMMMNIAANMLGLNNAATPLGLRAMRDLERLNRFPGVASNAMCMFLAINTGSPQLIPITAIAILAAAGSKNPNAIVGAAFLATICSSVAGIIAAKLLEKLPWYRMPETAAPSEGNGLSPGHSETKETNSPQLQSFAVAAMTPLKSAALVMFLGSFILFGAALVFPGQLPFISSGDGADAPFLIRMVKAVSTLAIPFLLSFFPVYGFLRGVKVYEEFVEGAKEGFQVAVKIIPFLVAMLVSISMFRAAEGITLLTRALDPVLKLLHFPAELVPLALMRPISGGGSLGIFSEMVKTFGPDHLLTRMAGTIYGSTETTFYVIAVYFGSVGVKKTRHAVPAGLIADLTGIIASVVICRMVFGN